MTNPGSNLFSETRGARRVLVIDPGMLGDTLHLLPAMWELRRNFPRAELHVLCSPVGAEVHAMAGCAERCWVLSQARQKRRLGDQIQLLRDLRRLQFDLSINFGTNDRNLVYARCIGARRRLGLKHDRWHFWSAWCIPDWVTVAGRGRLSFEHRREILASAGFPLENANFGLTIPEDAKSWAAVHAPERAIHLSVNASTPLKEWPLRHWCDLANHLFDRNPNVRLVATGSDTPRERERLESFRATVNRPGLLIFPGLPIAQLAALLSRCSLHIGADSGVLHLAFALGKPTVSLFRNYPGREGWTPQGPEHRAFIAECPCVGKQPPPCLERKLAACLDGISSQSVLAATSELMGGSV